MISRAFCSSSLLTSSCDGPLNNIRCETLLPSEEIKDLILLSFRRLALSSASARVLYDCIFTKSAIEFLKIYNNYCPELVQISDLNHNFWLVVVINLDHQSTLEISSSSQRLELTERSDCN